MKKLNFETPYFCFDIPMLESETTMNASTVIDLSNDSKGNSELKIPTASELATSLATSTTKVGETDTKNDNLVTIPQAANTQLVVAQQQSQIIEKAFADLTPEQKDTAKVKFVLSEPLTAEHNKQLLEKGYCVRQHMSYDSTKDSEVNGKYKVTLIPNQLAGQELSRHTNYLQRQMDSFADDFWPYTHFDSWPRYSIFNRPTLHSHRSFFPSLWF